MKDGGGGDFSAGYESDDEPRFEAPPLFAGQDERRMHVRAYQQWVGLLNGRKFPAPADLDVLRDEDFGPHSFLMDFREGRLKPILRFIGARLQAECTLDDEPYREAPLDVNSVPRRSLLSRLTDHYLEIIANRAPVGFEAEFTSRRGHETLYRGILMPLSSDGRVIDYMYGVINWKELAEADLGQVLAREAGLGQISGLATRFPAMAAPTSPLGTPAGLADRLTDARGAADVLQGANDRSRIALYAALSAAWNVHLAAQQAPGHYRVLLQNNGLTAQARAPMTPLLKLVFGIEYDKSRLTEFAAVLSHARRQNVPEDGMLAFLAGFDGGLKGVVRAERAARRAETAQPTEDRLAATRRELRSCDPLASLSLDVELADGDEFVLMMARRQPDGSLGIVAAVPHRDDLMKRVLSSL
ncbi:hypothetical protein ACSMXM_13155 [Pacificimonas sp. ICDLI1SI03]